MTDVVKIIEEVVEAMQVGEEARFKICSGYVLSGAPDICATADFM